MRWTILLLAFVLGGCSSQPEVRKWELYNIATERAPKTEGLPGTFSFPIDHDSSFERRVCFLDGTQEALMNCLRNIKTVETQDDKLEFPEDIKRPSNIKLFGKTDKILVLSLSGVHFSSYSKIGISPKAWTYGEYQLLYTPTSK